VGSPPAVADGRAYVTTNAGAVAAVDAETGEPIWGYQYDSKVNSASGPTHVHTVAHRARAWNPGNPLIVSRGLVLCLPADGGSLLALEAHSGKPRWTQPRDGLADLTAIDADRVLLSGKGLTVRRISDGEALGPVHRDLGIVGRPAVTGRRVLASSMGRVCVMDLDTYAVGSLQLSRPDGMLGNLVSAGGRLIASSMLGTCTYLSFDMAIADLDRRIGEAPEPERPAVMLRKAHLAFDARRFDLAGESLLACAKLLKRHHDADVANQLRPLTYRTYVALGNGKAAAPDMLRLFEKARAVAETRQEKAHMALRIAKCLERCERHADAAAAAQKLMEDFGDEDIVDVEIGEKADDAVRFSARRGTLPARRIAKRFIGTLIEVYGRECYEKFDAKAQQELAAARQAGKADKVLAVHERWPNSVWSDDSLFHAAEIEYRRAQADPNVAQQAVSAARRHLDAVFRDSESPLRASAGAALAVIYTRRQWRTLAHSMIAKLRPFDGATQVAFADITGRLDEVLRRIESGQGPLRPRAVVKPGRLRPPLVEKFSFKDEWSGILTSQDYRPVRIDGRVVLITEGDAVMLDVSKARAEADWKTPAGIAKASRTASNPPCMRLIGALSKDRRILAVADRVSARGIDVVTGKTTWHCEYAKAGLGSFFQMGAGQGVLVVADTSGKVICVDLSDGKKLWDNRVAGNQSRLPYGPPRIGGGLVIFRADNSKTVSAMSLSRQGYTVAAWSAQQRADAVISPDGIILLMLDGTLTAREPGNLDKPIWSVQYDVNKNPGILAATRDMVAVAPDGSGGPVHVLSITGSGRKLATLATARFDDSPALAFDAVFDRGNLLVMCATWQMLPRRGGTDNRSRVRGLCLQKFSLADGKMLWKRTLAGRTEHLNSVLPMVVGQDHVVVTARHTYTNKPYYVHVIDLKDGRDAQKIDLRGRGANSTTDRRRRMTMGTPAMTNGRLVVETTQGVSVYGEK
jgi:outer membrane protein assembly factor BamB